MTENIDWEAKIEALDASLPERLERAARMAERSDIWTDTERLMPATGVADLIWEAHSEILGWRALNEERKASRTCPLGEDCDLTVAWMAGRESAKDEAQVMVTDAQERIWVNIEPEWMDGDGNLFVGGTWDAGHLKEGSEYVRADVAAAMVAAALEEAAREIDCGCAHRSEVLAATGVDRWKFCGDPCAALDAREVRALIPDAGAALDRALEKARAGVKLTPQPIETAPMDGTKILVFPYSDTDEIQVSWFIEQEDRWANWNWSSDPTHWMPKPDFAKLKEDQ